MGVLHSGASSFAVILEDEHVLETLVALQINDAVAKSVERIFNALLRHGGERELVLRSFDDDLMRADSVHAVINALGLTVKISFDTQRGIFIRHHAHRPARRIGRAAVAGAIGEDLGRSLAFVSRAEGAEAAFLRDAFANEILRALGTLTRDDDPASGDGVAAKFRQWRGSSGLAY